MKRNKLAAGALALALGLGAVAPVAAEASSTGAGIAENQSRYRKLESEFDALAKEYAVLKKSADEAQAARDAQQVVVNGIKAEIKAWNDEKEAAGKALIEASRNLTTAKKENNDAKIHEPIANTETGLASVDEGSQAQKQHEFDVKYEIYQSYMQGYKTENLSYTEYDGTPASIQVESPAADGKKYVEKDELNKKLGKAETKLNILDADASEKRAKAEAKKAQAEAKYEELRAYAKENGGSIADFESLVQTAGQSNLPATNSSKTTGNNSNGPSYNAPVVKTPSKADLEALKLAVEDAKTTMGAVDLLKELSPEKIKDVVGELDKRYTQAEADVKAAKKILDKYSASIFSVAYAAEEEEVTSDDVKELTERLNKNTAEMQELIKDKEEDKKPEEEEPKAEEPKAEEPKKEEPKEEKKEEKKPEENKKAGNNASTGVVGLAGVAGVLAAASAAYAASKRD